MAETGRGTPGRGNSVSQAHKPETAGNVWQTANNSIGPKQEGLKSRQKGEAGGGRAGCEDQRRLSSSCAVLGVAPGDGGQLQAVCTFLSSLESGLIVPL